SDVCSSDLPATMTLAADATATCHHLRQSIPAAAASEIVYRLLASKGKTSTTNMVQPPTACVDLFPIENPFAGTLKDCQTLCGFACHFIIRKPRLAFMRP